ncbi:LPXTG cell wall anchor domain-containing protein [Candidatus Sodalis endolongispinus]|uniref:LPXTG cell wall anchor domain-containing protein n=1 Tax=Candidatus Sodalis endolongispinus TaxID=2812662 RepID=A0ABS5YAJ3_9GAMM|nr:LPXTG cell wall anchor domain-containing protein [Candidatus Sodalis endolongispinus]MBT9431968.1 LPXTG cell wall anchor domain-containing protein [Candidatus Sodalis endolongispinus]
MPTANIEPTTQTLSDNAKLDAATLSDPIKPTAKAVADDDKSTVDVIAKDTQSIANTPTDNIEPEPDTGSGSDLPVIVGLGVAAGGTASIYYAVKKKAVKMTMRMRDSIPMLVRSP